MKNLGYRQTHNIDLRWRAWNRNEADDSRVKYDRSSIFSTLTAISKCNILDVKLSRKLLFMGSNLSEGLNPLVRTTTLSADKLFWILPPTCVFCSFCCWYLTSLTLLFVMSSLPLLEMKEIKFFHHCVTSSISLSEAFKKRCRVRGWGRERIMCFLDSSFEAHRRR